MDETIESLAVAYRTARGTEQEVAAAEALAAAVVDCAAPLPRAILDLAFWAANACKKIHKPQRRDGVESGDKTRFLLHSRQIVSLRKRIQVLPENEQKLAANQVGPYHWAVYAVATTSEDTVEVREQAELFRKIYNYRLQHGWKPEPVDEGALRKIASILSPNHDLVQQAVALGRSGNLAGCVRLYHDALEQGALSPFDAQGYGWKMVKRIWGGEARGRELRFLMSDFLKLAEDALPEGDENARKIRHGFLVGLAKRIHTLEKGPGGNRVAIPYDVASSYLLVAEQNCELLLQEDFVRRAVTAEERVNMEKAAGKKVRLKEWPSNVETVVGVAAHCLKEHAFTPAQMRPGDRLLAFLGGHLDAGEWFGFHYAMWLKMLGRTEESTTHLLKTVESKKNEAWAWDYLGETYVNDPEKARACYCRALTCPVHDEDISTAMAKKTHRKLATVLRALHEDEAAERELVFAQSDRPLPGQRDYYLRHAEEARLLLLGDRKTRRFEGTFKKAEGKGFGFVQIGPNRGDSVFVPPSLAGRLSDGAHVVGIAVLGMDAKKGRTSWVAEILH